MTTSTYIILTVDGDHTMHINYNALKYLAIGTPMKFIKDALKICHTEENMKRIYREFIEIRVGTKFKTSLSSPAMHQYFQDIRFLLYMIRGFLKSHGELIKNFQMDLIEMIEKSNEKVQNGDMMEGEYLKECKAIKSSNHILTQFQSIEMEYIERMIPIELSRNNPVNEYVLKLSKRK